MTEARLRDDVRATRDRIARFELGRTGLERMGGDRTMGKDLRCTFAVLMITCLICIVLVLHSSQQSAPLRAFLVCSLLLFAWIFYKCSITEKQKLNLFLIGMMGAGKSTLVNNMNHVSRDNPEEPCTIDKIAEEQAPIADTSQGGRAYYGYNLKFGDVYDGVGLTDFNDAETREMSRVLDHGVAHRFRPDYAQDRAYKKVPRVGASVSVDCFIVVINWQQIYQLGDDSVPWPKDMKTTRTHARASFRAIIATLKEQHGHGKKPLLCITQLDQFPGIYSRHKLQKFVRLAEEVTTLKSEEISFLALHTNLSSTSPPPNDLLKDLCILKVIEAALTNGNRALEKPTFYGTLKQTTFKALRLDGAQNGPEWTNTIIPAVAGMMALLLAVYIA